MKILIEGLDLAGKSTVCRRLMEQTNLDWEHRRNALTADNEIYELADRLRKAEGAGNETLGWLYYAALRQDLDRFTAPAPGKAWLQDSTLLLRSYAYHSAFGTPRLPELLAELAPRLPKFDYAFVLTAPVEVRLARLEKRQSKNLGPEDFLVRDDLPRFQAMEATLIEAATTWLDARLVDTSSLELQNLDFIFNHLPPGITKSPEPNS